MDKAKIHWVLPDYDAIGNGFGYSHHNRMMRRFSEKYFEYDESADIALHIISGDKFVPIPGKINILFTMWEFLDIPNTYIKAFDKADAIVVPSSFCKKIFAPHTSKPIYTCWEGVDPSLYKFKARRAPLSSEKFRFLWVGAPNPRKGYPWVLEAVKVVEEATNCEIYIKTTVPKMTIHQALRSIWRNRKDIFFRFDNKGRQVRRSVASVLRFLNPLRPYYNGELKVMGKNKNIFYDTRKLSIEELIGLYESAHCFLLPTMGEGWGLTLCEAMATGCPSIATPVTGCADFFDDAVGYPIRYHIHEQDLTENYNMKARGYLPDTKDFIQQMINVMSNYNKALHRGEKASERIRGKFTWEKSAKRLYEIINEVTNDHRLNID